MYGIYYIFIFMFIGTHCANASTDLTSMFFMVMLSVECAHDSL